MYEVGKGKMGITRLGECKEIENVECLLCEEGLYLYKLYTAGHLMDTTTVWIGLFFSLPLFLLPPPLTLSPLSLFPPLSNRAHLLAP